MGVLTDAPPPPPPPVLPAACHKKKCDRDGSGHVSLEEFVLFSSREGVERSTAQIMFFQADVDGNGGP